MPYSRINRSLSDGPGLLLFISLSFFFPLLLPLFLSGLKVNINQQQHLCCVLLFILQSYAAAAVLSEEVHQQYSADTCGLFMEVLVVVLCNMLAIHSCGPKYVITQWIFHFKMPCCWDNSRTCSGEILLFFLNRSFYSYCIYCSRQTWLSVFTSMLIQHHPGT